MTTANWIEGKNPFKLSPPPKWWLTKLWDFDSSLVMMTSHKDRLYRLAQRRPPTPAKFLVDDLLWADSDARAMAREGLVPVTSLLAEANWENPLLFQELARRAPWRQGGTEAFLKKIEDREASEKAATEQYVSDMMDERHSDAYKLWRNRQGLGKSYHLGDMTTTPASS